MQVQIIKLIIMHAIVPFVGKFFYLLTLWLVKRLLRALKWLSVKTGTKLDDELVEIMERALELQEQEVVPQIPAPSEEPQDAP